MSSDSWIDWKYNGHGNLERHLSPPQHNQVVARSLATSLSSCVDNHEEYSHLVSSVVLWSQSWSYVWIQCRWYDYEDHCRSTEYGRSQTSTDEQVEVCKDFDPSRLPSTSSSNNSDLNGNMWWIDMLIGELLHVGLLVVVAGGEGQKYVNVCLE